MGGLASRLVAAIRNTGCTCFDAVTHQTLGHDPFFLRSMCGLPARDEQDADVPPTLLYRMRTLFQDAWQHGLGDGTGGVEQNRCTLEGYLFSPFSNDGKNENPKSEEFLDSGAPQLALVS